MKTKKSNRILAWCSIVFIIMIIATPLVVSNFFLPSEIKLLAGEEHYLNFEVPLVARLLKEDSLIIKNNEQELVGNEVVSLNKPLSVMMPEEGEADVTLSFMGLIPIKTVSVKAISYQTLIPCGDIVGIKVDTNGVIVLGVGEFETENAMISPCKGIIEAGDVILKCNGKPIENKEGFRDLIETAHSKELVLDITHKGEEKQVKIVPAYSRLENEYKIGLWIKDSTQGIGTITYINPENGHFGALGHGITDAQTRVLTPVRDGEIMKVLITRITKGEKGEPGELSGIIDYDERSLLGNICLNNTLGIYGTVEESYLKHKKNEALPIAFQDEVHEGQASIMLDLTGEGAKEYDVEIQRVSKYNSEPSKGMTIRIIDERLLNMTNGIIQGMSGSPILQDGKIIGAITHVFVNDPTRGYGVFIENMINSF